MVTASFILQGPKITAAQKVAESYLPPVGASPVAEAAQR